MTNKKKQPETLTESDLDSVQGGGPTGSTTGVSKGPLGSGLNGVMPGDHVTHELDVVDPSRLNQVPTGLTIK